MIINSKNKKTPIVIATGFTTAYLGDERTLREFIVGNHIVQEKIKAGENAILYLINDSYDPLNYRQLKVALLHNDELIKKFEKYCGQPIAEIPDPFDCHASYADHFADLLRQRLKNLDIYPNFIDTYKSYKSGYYADYIKLIFEQYNNITNAISDKFENYSMKKLFWVQCSNCKRLDETYIVKIMGNYLKYHCDNCNTTKTQKNTDICGKFSWKMDCAARWNIYNIDIETFSKAHTQGLGSLEISRFISEKYFNAKVPETIRYGMVGVSKKISYRILEVLPPQMLKKLFTEHITRDIVLNKDFIANFAHKYYISDKMSYVDFVTHELPHLAIRDANSINIYNSSLYTDLKLNDLIECGNRYSGLFYNKEYNINLAATKNIHSVDIKIARAARKFIHYALDIRKNETNEQLIKTNITEYLSKNKHESRVYPYLRKIFGQEAGPSISTLLVTLPYDYLNLIYMTLGYYTGDLDSIGGNEGSSKIIGED